VHEEVHEGAERQDHPGEKLNDVGAMLGPEEIAGRQEEHDRRDSPASSESIRGVAREGVFSIRLAHVQPLSYFVLRAPAEPVTPRPFEMKADARAHSDESGHPNAPGCFRSKAKQPFLSNALSNEYIGLEEVADGIWNRSVESTSELGRSLESQV
jgi:hypothetical protein